MWKLSSEGEDVTKIERFRRSLKLSNKDVKSIRDDGKGKVRKEI